MQAASKSGRGGFAAVTPRSAAMDLSDAQLRELCNTAALDRVEYLHLVGQGQGTPKHRDRRRSTVTHPSFGRVSAWGLVVHVPAQLSSFHVLREINMRENFLTELSHLHTCRELWDVDFSHNKVRWLPPPPLLLLLLLVHASGRATGVDMRC